MKGLSVPPGWVPQVVLGLLTGPGDGRGSPSSTVHRGQRISLRGRILRNRVLNLGPGVAGCEFQSWLPEAPALPSLWETLGESLSFSEPVSWAVEGEQRSVPWGSE